MALMRLTLGITEAQFENLKECNCGQKMKCVYYCTKQTCPNYRLQTLYCENCKEIKENHDHGHDQITKSCERESKEHSALASLLQDALKILNPIQERFYSLVFILSAFAKANNLELKKDMSADFDKLGKIENQVNTLLKTEKALVVKYDIIELLKLIPEREQLKKELLSLEYLVDLNYEMIEENYEKVFKHQASIRLSSLNNEEDKDFIYYSKIRAIQSQTSQVVIDLKAAFDEERKKNNDEVYKLSQKLLNSNMGQLTLQQKVTQTVNELSSLKQLFEQRENEHRSERQSMERELKTQNELVQSVIEQNKRFQEQLRIQGAECQRLQNQMQSLQNQQIEVKQDQQEMKCALEDIKKTLNGIQMPQSMQIQGGAQSLDSSLSHSTYNDQYGYNL
ncbi:hypothetical protein FGO68_gene14447 [Halteria grandinella]|uniref:Uncharacterized protein n=1 Tax=Halteria grandinella TaxID=5974 RepID=A0A8J8NNZ6_HALGN|nr:hypothetical protein FGO68_gene14447 [Halteria grandinella]